MTELKALRDGNAMDVGHFEYQALADLEVYIHSYSGEINAGILVTIRNEDQPVDDIAWCWATIYRDHGRFYCKECFENGYHLEGFATAEDLYTDHFGEIPGHINAALEDGFIVGKQDGCSYVRLLKSPDEKVPGEEECLVRCAVGNISINSLNRRDRRRKHLSAIHKYLKDSIEALPHIKAYAHSLYNEQEVKASANVSCFYCLNTFPVSELKEEDYMEERNGMKTVFCPYCGVDALIGDASEVNCTPKLLQQMKNHWF